MAVTLIKNPIGHKLSDSEIDAGIFNDLDRAMVYLPIVHALSTGDYVYVQSNIDAYNGFKYVVGIDAYHFYIKDSENSDYIEYIQDADITYRVSVLNHGWQAVHNPIVYELESDLYPNNDAEEAYTPNTIISQSEEGGLTRLALSAALVDPTELSKIKLFGVNDLEGVYQIVTVYEDWNIVIDLPYDSSNSFTSLQVIKWYDNYAINVKVWAGVSFDHRWEALKPFEVAATLQLIPDNDNKIKFSISDVLRSYINTRNNLTLNTLPNNLDFMVAFYIEFFESYDQSDGEEITRFDGDITTDSFVGYAVNAKMPFKSESVSHMSDYINEDVFLARWLTIQTRPIAVVDRFFDLSFINQYNTTDILIDFTKSLDGVGTYELVTITNPGYGVLRVPFTPESGYDEYCVQARTAGSPGSGGVTTPIVIPDLSDGINLFGTSPSWSLGANPYVVLPGASGNHNTDRLSFDYAFIDDYEYNFTIDFDNSSARSSSSIVLAVMNSSNTVLVTSIQSFAAATNYVKLFTFTAPAGGVKYSIRILNFEASPVSDTTVDINSITAGETTPIIPAVPSQTITERICIDIIEECDTTFIEDPDDIRLTEDGDFRILE